VSTANTVIAKLARAGIAAESATAPRVEGLATLEITRGADLIARFVGPDTPPRVVAFVSVAAKDVVAATVSWLADEVERTTGTRCLTTTAAEFVDVAAEPVRVVSGQGARHPRLFDPPPESDFVLVDASALPLDGELLGLARRVDSVVIVVEAGRTRRKDLAQTVSALKAVGGQVAGFVLHRRKPMLPRWLDRWIG
jgi:hypothetical protein